MIYSVIGLDERIEEMRREDGEKDDDDGKNERC